MEDSLKSAISLYQGDSLSITGKSSHALSRYFERMGVLQDVMTSNLDLEKAQRTRKPITDANASFRSHAPLLSKQERLDWLDGGDVGFNIYIGRHNGVLGLGPFLNIARHASLPEFRDYGYGKRFTYVIGKLVAVIELKNNSRKIPTSLFRLSRDKLEIPDDVFVGYKEIISLQNRDLYMATLNFWFSQPLLKDVIESESKDRGALMWPEFLESITPTDLAAVVAATPLADRWWSDTI